MKQVHRRHKKKNFFYVHFVPFVANLILGLLEAGNDRFGIVGEADAVNAVR